MGYNADVTCNCDGCGQCISERDEVYCESCYTGESTDHTASPSDIECGGCNKQFSRSMMIEKLPGLRCRKCAAKIEAEAMELLKPKSAKVLVS